METDTLDSPDSPERERERAREREREIWVSTTHWLSIDCTRACIATSNKPALYIYIYRVVHMAISQGYHMSEYHVSNINIHKIY